MQKQMLLAVVLSILAIAGYTYLKGAFFTPPPPEAPAKNGSGNGRAPDGAMNGTAPVPPEPPAGPKKPERVREAADKEFAVAPEAGPYFDVGFTTRGGAIRWIRLRDAYEQPARVEGPRARLDLVLPGRPDLLTGMVSIDRADSESMRTRNWALESAPGANPVVFSFKTASGLRIVKTITVPTEPLRADIAIELRVEKASGAPAANETATLTVLGVAGLAQEPVAPTSIQEPVSAYVKVVGHQDEPWASPWYLNEITLGATDARAFRILGIKSQYFTAAVFSDGGADAPRIKSVWCDGGDADRRGDTAAAEETLDRFFRERDQRVASESPVLKARVKDAALNFHRAWLSVETPVVAAGAPAKPTTLNLYAGPLSREILGEDRYAPVSEVLVYPTAPDVLAKFLLLIWDFFHGITGSAGLAVILMTLAVRGSLIPLSVRNQLSLRRHGRKVARLKPKLDRLKEKWGHDPRKFREEQVKLFREHGIGFPMGCLILLIQMPIFFALFSCLRIEYGLRHEAFAWIDDLSGPDALIEFGAGFSLIGFPPGGIHGINLLPLLYMALAIYQQRQMPKPLDEQQMQQQKIAKWMMIIFPILLYNYTAALALYMIVSSGVAIVEARMVRIKDRHDQEKEAATYAAA